MERFKSSVQLNLIVLDETGITKRQVQSIHLLSNVRYSKQQWIMIMKRQYQNVTATFSATALTAKNISLGSFDIEKN